MSGSSATRHCGRYHPKRPMTNLTAYTGLPGANQRFLPQDIHGQLVQVFTWVTEFDHKAAELVQRLDILIAEQRNFRILTRNEDKKLAAGQAIEPLQKAVPGCGQALALQLAPPDFVESFNSLYPIETPAGAVGPTPADLPGDLFMLALDHGEILSTSAS
ncbi:unnamed protein product [Cyclocybe aegerita]|uniref:Uncharacterized protein n=1 Tax=Cyclocybe aegerita TaxID=1973307 RepID=A0A8S0W4S8_CYCAE|nr:unnamed protein product [Cyclocybe aegerita]